MLFRSQAWSEWASWSQQTLRNNNTLPVAGVTGRTVGLGQWIRASELSITVTDADGDTISVTAVGTPTSGSVSFNSSNATYVASGGTGTNTFTYTVADAFGATDTKTVTVVVSDPQGFNLMSAGVSGGNAVLTYLGVPGMNYALDITHTLPATNWSFWSAAGMAASPWAWAGLSVPTGAAPANACKQASASRCSTCCN